MKEHCIHLKLRLKTKMIDSVSTHIYICQGTVSGSWRTLSSAFFSSGFGEAAKKERNVIGETNIYHYIIEGFEMFWGCLIYVMWVPLPFQQTNPRSPTMIYQRIGLAFKVVHGAICSRIRNLLEDQQCGFWFYKNPVFRRKRKRSKQ